MSETPLIVCVDDDPSVAEAIKALLKACGSTAEAFLSAEEFLQFGRLEDTSCLITDVQLGGMSGLQLQNRLADSGYGIPIIFITAFPDEQIRERGLSAGAACFPRAAKTISAWSALRLFIDVVTAFTSVPTTIP